MTSGEGCDSGRELRRIVGINEEIKRVVKIAFRINLMAMNAIFLAKRAGHSALGFGALSQELHRFAAELEQQMKALGQATGGCVVAVTAMVKDSRLLDTLTRTRSQCGGVGSEALDAILRHRRDAALLRRRERVAAVNRSLKLTIEDTMRLIEMGGVLARSAKIEAAYGGEFRKPLRQVSCDFEATIGEIRQSLDGLGRFRLRELSV